MKEEEEVAEEEEKPMCIYTHAHNTYIHIHTYMHACMRERECVYVCGCIVMVVEVMLYNLVRPRVHPLWRGWGRCTYRLE